MGSSFFVPAQSGLHFCPRGIGCDISGRITGLDGRAKVLLCQSITNNYDVMIGKLMTGKLIGGGLSLVGGILGGIASARANKRAQREVEQQRAKNDAWFDRRYNEDATQRADAQRALTIMRQQMADNTAQAQGAAAVSGASDESVALAKANANQAMADATSGIAAQAAQEKMAIENQHNAVDNALSGEKRQLDIQNAEQNAKAVTQAFNTGASILGNLNIWGKK